MKGEKLEEWQRLCALAAVEQDHEKLLQPVKKSTALLDEKEQRLRNNSPKAKSDGHL
jgi:hypothetical protein